MGVTLLQDECCLSTDVNEEHEYDRDLRLDSRGDALETHAVPFSFVIANIERELCTSDYDF